MVVVKMNDWLIAEALLSVRRLEAVADQLSLAEIEKAIRLEETAGRRSSLLARLRRLARTRAVEGVRQRTEGTSLI